MSAPAEIRLPAGWASEDPAVLRWVAADGAAVSLGQPICELEAAKATAEMLSPAAGTLRWALPDGAVREGALLGRIHAPGETVPSATVSPRKTPPRGRSARKAAEIRVLSEARSGSLPSTVLRQVPIGGLADALREEGASVTALVVHELGRLLRTYPVFNSSYEEDGTRANERVRVGVAVDVEPHGLKLVLVDDPDTRSLEEVASDLQVLLYRYLTKALSPADLRGATITLTDLTAFGASWSIPLLVDRQAAILALGSFPTAAGPVLTLALTFDHRVASGREAALLLRDLAARISARAALSPLPCVRCGRRPEQMDPARAYVVSVVGPEGPSLVCPDCLGLAGA